MPLDQNGKNVELDDLGNVLPPPSAKQQVADYFNGKKKSAPPSSPSDTSYASDEVPSGRKEVASGMAQPPMGGLLQPPIRPVKKGATTDDKQALLESL